MGTSASCPETKRHQLDTLCASCSVIQALFHAERPPDLSDVLILNQCWGTRSWTCWVHSLLVLTVTFSLSQFFWTNVTHFNPNAEMIILCPWPERPGLFFHLQMVCVSTSHVEHRLVLHAGLQLWYSWGASLSHSFTMSVHTILMLSFFFSTRGLSGSVLPSAAASSGHPEDHPGQRHHRGHRYFPAVPSKTQTGWEQNDVHHGQQQHLLDGGAVL